jgi:DNA-binding CsgD family transcriptional regulator
VAVLDAELPRLTPRERECLQLVARHMHSKEIGRALDLSPFTVDKYIESACERLGVRSRREAARKFLEIAGEEYPNGSGNELLGLPERPEFPPPPRHEEAERHAINSRRPIARQQLDPGFQLGRVGGQADGVGAYSGEEGHGPGPGFGGAQTVVGGAPVSGARRDSGLGLGAQRRDLSTAIGSGIKVRDPLAEFGKIAFRAIAIGLLLASVVMTAHTGLVLAQRWYFGWKPISTNALPDRAQSLKNH